MKATTAVMTALLMGAATVSAPAQVAIGSKAEQPYFSSVETHYRVDLRNACKNYMACLASENEGVVESAIAHVIRMKMVLQNETFCDLRSAINSLAVTGSSPSIRYRAYLASLILDNPSWFAEECVKDYKNPTEMYTALANRLDKTLLSHAGRKYVRPE